MAVEFEAVFVGIGVLDVDLGVLEVDCVFVEGVTIHGGGDLILEKFAAGLPHSHSSLGISANFE
jgi:hypothetical protein